MAFAVVAVTLLATCLQSSFAAVVTETATAAAITTTTAPSIAAPAVSPLGIMTPPSAVNSLNPVNNLYNSPYIPDSLYSGVDLLNDFPYYNPCDCNFASLIDPTVMNEMSLITTRYNQRSCSLQQWERLINNNMPGIDSVNSLNMISSLASAVQREQIRRDLAYGNYPEMCVNLGPALNDVAAATATTVTSTAAASTVLARREPQAVATAATAATTTTVSSAPAAPWADSPYSYTMQYLFDRALPNVSADLRLDVVNSVLANTPAAYWSSAYPLAQQLTSNIRGMVSDMVDLSVPSVTVTY